jgi:hypothetical protein
MVLALVEVVYWHLELGKLGAMPRRFKPSLTHAQPTSCDSLSQNASCPSLSRVCQLSAIIESPHP